MIKNELERYIYRISPKYCEHCGTAHSPEDLKILKMQDDEAVCKLKCHNCNVDCLIHINISTSGTVSGKKYNSNVLLSAKEIKKFSKAKRIKTDEKIEIFEDLNKVKDINDFNKLLSSSKD